MSIQIKFHLLIIARPEKSYYCVTQVHFCKLSYLSDTMQSGELVQVSIYFGDFIFCPSSYIPLKFCLK